MNRNPAAEANSPGGEERHFRSHLSATGERADGAENEQPNDNRDEIPVVQETDNRIHFFFLSDVMNAKREH